MTILWSCLVLTLSACASAAATRAIVTVPATTVWSKLAEDPKTLTDEDRETQLLEGEHVIIHETRGDWARIEAVEQPEYSHKNKWEGYPGWVLKNTLVPAKLETKPLSPGTTNPLDFPMSVIGTPYLWGGMSSEGYDCSSLVHLSYRKIGQVIPRDSHEQWMKAKPIQAKDLKPGDLVFSAKVAKPAKIVHVSLYIGDGQLLEAPQTGMNVRKVSFQEKYGKPLTGLQNGTWSGDRIIYFGTFRQ